MRIFLQKSILILLIFSFTATVLKMNSYLFSDVNEELLEEFLDLEEKDSLDEFSTYEFKTDFYFSKTSNPSFYLFKSNMLNKVCSLKYCEPTLDNPFSPPELIS